MVVVQRQTTADRAGSYSVERGGSTAEKKKKTASRLSHTAQPANFPSKQARASPANPVAQPHGGQIGFQKVLKIRGPSTLSLGLLFPRGALLHLPFHNHLFLLFFVPKSFSRRPQSQKWRTKFTMVPSALIWVSPSPPPLPVAQPNPRAMKICLPRGRP